MEQEALLEVALALAEARESDEVLDLITEKSLEVAQAEAGSLLLLDRETGRLRFHVARGRVAPALAQASLEIGVGIAGTVATTGKPVLVKDAYADSRFSRTFDDATGFVTHSLVTVPLVSREKRVLGVVQVLNRKGKVEFDQEDLELLEAFAAQAAVALEKARLYDDTRCMAEDLRQALEQERNLAIEKEKMGAYIPKQVVDAISRSREQKLALGGKTLRASVLFADIQGFTRLSEDLDPQETVRFLNSYMTAMTHVIEEEGGVVDKFIGDGIMAVFTQECCDRPALRAVRSGMRMQEALKTILPDLATENPRLQGLRIRVGINTGDVVSGNIGSETRMDYTVVGDNVNVASRIESSCEPGRVWISSSTYEEVADAIEARAMSPIQVKNRVKPVLCYSVEEIKGMSSSATRATGGEGGAA
jgi:class 3 adenylate cyclase